LCHARAGQARAMPKKGGESPLPLAERPEEWGPELLEDPIEASQRRPLTQSHCKQQLDFTIAEAESEAERFADLASFF